MNLLFICSKNQWRSPTAQKIWDGREGHLTRSAGTARSARHKVSHGDISWADIIFVMEQKHKTRLKADFRQLLNHKPLYVLDIPDDYHYMDAELVEILEEAIPALSWNL